MDPSANQALINRFYEAFARLDGEAMAECYSAEVVFKDPAFGELKGAQAGNMWRMLCASQQGKDFQVTFSEVHGDAAGGTARWEARYTFSKTGRKVHNIIEARFEIEGGKITGHTDTFDLKRWAAQALGFKGALLGGTKFFRRKLQGQTRGMLSKFEAR